MTDFPPVREEDWSIEIDVKKGKWPFLKAAWAHDGKGRPRLIIHADANNAAGNVREHAAGQVGVVGLSKKKAQRLLDFLRRTIDEIPD